MNGTYSFSNPWLQWQQTLIDETSAAMGRMTHLPTLWQRAQRIRKGVSPTDIVYEEDRLKLYHYTSEQPPRYRTPLVFIYALVNRPYILDLKKGRSVVANFVNAGFDTYLVDWGIPTSADRHLTLDDYINGYMVSVLDYLRERTGAEKANILGYCMGGTMSAMFTALHPERVQNLTLLAAPIDFATPEGLLNIWTRPEFF
ncbi:MAG TPA: alpha/beta fold hydrolase, partial [Candidatus Sulfotelmatobacter sp.]|nr:alpha/beta fold hydrolase [Candidatus Sulfotelmatobacter sp.]